MNKYYKDNLRIILSIVFTLIFFVGATYLWSNLNKNYAFANDILNNNKQVILMENINVCSDIDSDYLLGYNVIITSNYNNMRNYNVKIVNDNINNQDIHYSINDSEIMVLNDDNTIIKRNIDAKGEHSYKLKIWLTNEYVNNDLNLVIEFE